MKFWTGFIIGAAVSGYLISNMTVEQRRRAAATMQKSAAKLRNTQVGDAVATGVSDIAGAAGERASAVVSNGTDSVANFVEADAN
ncbi:MAG: hypothetical protein HKO59_11230 [Phycisphaerales bacterium]|nr:hypothetical protein [Phycisphaerales bacterium]